MTHAVTYLPSDEAELSNRLFGQKINFFSKKIYICVFVYCGCICMISICVADNQL